MSKSSDDRYLKPITPCSNSGLELVSSQLGLPRRHESPSTTSSQVSSSQITSRARPQKVRLVTYAWGLHHVNDLVNYTLASVLAPGNLPALSRVFDCEVILLTEEAFFDGVRKSPTVRALQQICP